MKSTLRILMGLGVATLIVVLAVPATHAQCPTTRILAGMGAAMSTGRIVINTTTGGYPNNGNEFGSIFDANGAAAVNNGGAHFPTADTCPTLGAPGWYQTGTTTGIVAGDATLMGANSGINAVLSSPTCQLNACPLTTAKMTAVVEDATADGKKAGFIVYTLDETPAAPGARYYDHARTAGIVGIPSATAMQMFQDYPTVHVTSSSGPPPATTTTDNYADLALNYHGAGATVAATSGVVSYDIMSFHGSADPGRLRSLWTPLKQVPYNNAGVVGDQVSVPCPTPAGDTYLAVGVTFDGDGNGVLSAGDVKSALVGGSQPVECDPNIAQPDQPKVHRPVIQQRKQPLGR